MAICAVWFLVVLYIGAATFIQFTIFYVFFLSIEFIHLFQVLVSMDKCEIPEKYILKRWIKDASASSERVDDARISCVGVESLLKKVLLRKALDVVSGDVSVQDSRIMDAIQALCAWSHEENKNDGTEAATSLAAALLSERVPMSGPIRTAKRVGGRRILV